MTDASRPNQASSTPGVQTPAVGSPRRGGGRALGRFWRSRTLRRLRRNRLAVISAVFVVVLAALAVLAPLLPLQPPNAQTLSRRLESPSRDHWLGTDQVGRDVLSRVVFAARISLMAAIQAVGLAVALGVPLGLFTGFVGGWIDAVVSRAIDVVMALPSIILALAIVAILGPGLTNVMIAIGIIMAPTFYRIARATSRDVRYETYIEASRASGCTRRRILFRHVLPNAVSPLLVQLTFAVGVAIVAEASLSFLGLGVQPPQSSWGTMVAEGFRNLYNNSFLVVPPAVMITLSILAFAVLGDALRDALGRDTRKNS